MADCGMSGARPNVRALGEHVNSLAVVILFCRHAWFNAARLPTSNPKLSLPATGLGVGGFRECEQ